MFALIVMAAPRYTEVPIYHRHIRSPPDKEIPHTTDPAPIYPVWMIRHNHYLFSWHALTCMTKVTPVIASPLILAPIMGAGAQQAGSSNTNSTSDHSSQAEGGA